MTRLAVSIMVEAVQQAHAAAARAAEGGADLVEYRIDTFTGPDCDLAGLVDGSPLPCILTCRPVWEGGLCELDETARLKVFERAMTAGRPPAYIDIELAAYQKSPDLRRAVARWVDHPGQVGRADAGLILSSHDFEQRPVDLYQRIEAMVAAAACRVIKLAWRARSLRDNIEAFELLRHGYKPTIALCMGEAGLPSRVLARKFNGLLTFAALEADQATAPGQPTLEQLKTLYRWDATGPLTRVYGVIGHPVGHSMSPAIHNAGFDHTGFDGVYLPMPIPPDYTHFKATVGAWLDMADLHFRGASVTIPHKENLLRFVAERGGQIEPLAARIGAANTLTVGDDGTLHASNSDYAAALDAVCNGLGIGRAELAGRRVAVIGAGGAARAIVAGFAAAGATVVVYNRTLERARQLAEAFSAGGDGVGDGGGPAGGGGDAAGTDVAPGKVVAAPLEKLCDCCCQIYINCTPIGMHPDVDKTPIEASAAPRQWGEGTVVFDTIYNPIETRLLREARAADCITIPGTEMFTRQAAAQFQTWTGREAPLEVFEGVMRKRMGG